MKTNVGSTDAFIRWVLAAVFVAVAVAFNASPIIALVAALLALVMAGTALTRVCPLYSLFGFDSSQRSPPSDAKTTPAH